MSASLKQLADDVRRVWSPPGGRAWSHADVAITRLLTTIEKATAELDVRAVLDEEIAAADRMRDGEVSDHPQTKHDGWALGEALRRVKGRLVLTTTGPSREGPAGRTT